MCVDARTRGTSDELRAEKCCKPLLKVSFDTSTASKYGIGKKTGKKNVFAMISLVQPRGKAPFYREISLIDRGSGRTRVDSQKLGLVAAVVAAAVDQRLSSG
jgi:hypothetical protein